MRSLDVFERFDVMISFSTSLAFYDDKVNRDIFHRIYRVLKPDGVFHWTKRISFGSFHWINTVENRSYQMVELIATNTVLMLEDVS